LSSVVPQLGGEGGVHHGNTDKSVVMMGMGNDDMLFEELPAGRVYRLDVFTGELTFLPIVVSQQTLPSQQLSCIGKPQIPLLPSWVVEDEDIPYPILQAAERLYQHLNHAVRRRVMDAPIIIRTKEAIHQNQKQASSVAVLFSGGVDSVVLAALCHNHVPLDQPIDLINVAFASSECHGARKVVDPFSLSPDRQAALLSYQEMKCQWPNRHWRFIAVNVDYETVLEMEDTICKLISPLTSTMDFNIGTAMWFASRGLGEIVDYDNGENDLWKTQMLKESKHLRFCQKSSSASNKNGKSSDSFGPCMTRGCKRLAERDRCRFGVCKVCCSSIFQRRINQYLGGRSDFCHYHSEMAKSVKSKGKKKTSVQENVSKSSKVKQKKNKTETPSSDQVSHVQKEEKLLYQSCAKVVIVGIGADEQMAGYGRHRAIYNKGGYEALRQELAMEKSRLWTRNLGRDDRCISNHGKEARFPFLDDDVTAYLNSLDITEMVDMTKPQGMGDKMILRLVAKRLGVTQCSGLVKRAIQFGSRIAKCSEVDRFGSSRNASGSAKHIRGKTTAVD
jgi:Asparagine synthase (glutamine-hydrolyzing)